MRKTAAKFSSSVSYAVGDLCLYEGSLYIFTSSHTGAWNSSHVAAYDDRTANSLDKLLDQYAKAQAAVAFGNALVFEPAQITGTRYKYVLTTAHMEV